MANGTSSEDRFGQHHIDVGHIPVDSEEVIYSSKATLTVRKLTQKEIWVMLCISGAADGDILPIGDLTEQALGCLLPSGKWVTGKGSL